MTSWQQSPHLADLLGQPELAELQRVFRRGQSAARRQREAAQQQAAAAAAAAAADDEKLGHAFGVTI